MAEPILRAKESAWRAAGRDLCRLDWPQSNARPGLRCLPAFLVLLAVGLSTGSYANSAIATAAAMSAGFGSFQSFRKSRGRVMLLVTAALTVAAFSGSLSSRSLWGVLLAASGWAFLYGLLTVIDSGLSWVGLQAVIVAVVAGGFPVEPRQALSRAALTLGGGLLQTGLILGIWRLFGPPKEPVSSPPISWPEEKSGSTWQETLRLHWSPRSAVGRFAVQLAFCLLASAAFYQILHVPNGYWVPMTAVIVLRPEFHQTFTRGLARLAGTLAGVALATLLAVTLRPHPAVLCVLVLVFAWGSYALLRVNYGLFAACITAYVVFLLSLVGLPEKSIVLYRLLSTGAGGVIALSASLLPLHRLMKPAVASSTVADA